VHQTIDVAIRISVQQALARSQAKHGVLVIRLNTSDILGWTAEERAELAALPVRTDVPGCSPGAPALVLYEEPHYTSDIDYGDSVESLRAGLAQRMALRKARQAQDEAQALKKAQEQRAREEIDAAAVLERFLEGGAEGFYILNSLGFSLQNAVTAGGKYRIIPWHLPMLADLKRQVEAHAQTALAARQARWEAEKIAEAAVKEAGQAAVKEAEAQFQAWAKEFSSNPSTKRAAEEGYDVRKAVLVDVAAALPSPDALDKHTTSWEERSSPGVEAFALLDSLTEATKTLRKPECLNVTVSRVQRITEVDPDDGEKTYHTGVVVTLSSRITSDLNLIYFTQ
jgi:hypothetical protein